MGLDAGADLVAGYAGNGAIWHIRGNFDHFPSSTLPWSAVNLLNPHTVFRNGREVLYNLLDAADEHPPVPAIVSVRKDPRFGDILLLCSDGVSSADQVTQGTDSGGRLWTGAEPAMLAFYQALRELFAGWDGESDLPLQEAVHGWLHGLRARGILEDDATAGVIVTAEAIDYQRRAQAARAAADAPALSGGAAGAGAPYGEDAEAAREVDAGSADGRERDGEGGALHDHIHAGAEGEEAECQTSPASPA